MSRNHATLLMVSSLLSAACGSDSAVEKGKSVSSKSQRLTSSVEPGVDRPGLDYRGFALPSSDPMLCRDACRGESQCKAYTYVEKDIQGPNPMCWLKSSIPSPVPNSYCTAGVNVHDFQEIETNIDRAGSDYLSYEMPWGGFQRCQDDCDRDQNCEAFTYVRPGYQGKNARCYLKNGVPAATPSDCCISASKHLAMTTEPDMDRPGGDYRVFDVPGANYKLCRATCDLDPFCQVYTYVPPGVQTASARCWLKNQVPKGVPAKGLVSGQRF